jgi:two-component system, sensor histidine kinase
MDAITDLVITISNPAKSNDKKLEQICIATMQAITHANRVSLWAFNQAQSEIICLKCLSANMQFTSGKVLKKINYPEYFNTILKDEVIIASDARNHPATLCFNESYFVPLDIYSLFDYIYHKDFIPRGVICCESVGKKITWLEEESQILKRIANMTSILFDFES